MRSARGSPRLAVLAVAILVAALGIVALAGWRAVRLTPLAARAATLTSATDLQRPPWFHLQVLSSLTSFTPGTAIGSPAAISAAAGILVDVDSGTIIWQRDDHRELAPASTAKILTALVALENLDPSSAVTVTDRALHQAGDESRMGLLAGEKLTVRDLLSGMLLVSANDAGSALATDTVGMERFVAAMNAQVSALGLHDSHFTTPVGLDDPDQYTSAYDLAAISAAAIRRFPLFADLVGSRQVILPATADHPEFDLTSINLLLAMYPSAVGIKPGYTRSAGYCEVGMAVRDGHRLISVLLNGDYVVAQSRRLLDWGFQQEGLPSTLPLPPPSSSPSPAAHG